MKYNEAIDMILDGGEAYDELYPNEKVKFDKNTDILIMIDEEGEIHDHFCYDKKDFTEKNWIVEKDGVVYEKYQPKLEWITHDAAKSGYGLSCTLCHFGSRIGNFYTYEDIRQRNHQNMTWLCESCYQRGNSLMKKNSIT